METPWNRARKLKSTQQEHRLGKLPAGQVQPNSGRLWRWKRDGIVGNFLFEARTTEKKTYRIDADEIRAIAKQGHRTPPGLKPAMQIDLDTNSPSPVSLVVIQTVDFQRQQERLLELEMMVEDAEDTD